jgi:plasmid stabilization system protein ParE
MARGSKSKYTNKQKRKAEHIEEGYEKRGVSHKEAEKRAWATVNKQDGGGKKRSSTAKKNLKKHNGTHPPKKHQKSRKKTSKNKDR